MICLVCGGRGYWGDIDNALDHLHAMSPITMLVHGDAKGADKRSGEWAKKRGIHYAAVPALWDFYKLAAGSKRNRAMLVLKPEYCVASPGGTGTADMVELCNKNGVPVWQPYG